MKATPNKSKGMDQNIQLIHHRINISIRAG